MEVEKEIFLSGTQLYAQYLGDRGRYIPWRPEVQDSQWNPVSKSKGGKEWPREIKRWSVVKWDTDLAEAPNLVPSIHFR